MKTKEIKAMDVMVEDQVRQLFDTDLHSVDGEMWRMMTDRAKIGMQFVRDREINKRINQGASIRVINMVFKDEDSKRKYIRAAMPQLIPSDL